MAQTISAYAGYKGQTQGLPPKIGFYWETRKMQLPCAYFSLGKQPFWILSRTKLSARRFGAV